MKTIGLIWLGLVCGTIGTLCVAYAFCEEPSASTKTKMHSGNSSASDSVVDEIDRVSVVVATDRAKTMHNIYLATLDVIHDRYFHGDRAAVPARAMEDVFSEIRRQSKVEARWISVNTRAMSIGHEPKNDFEKRAAEKIAAGDADFEVVEDGYYRRAVAVPLADGCVSCHEGFFKGPSKTQKFAGLVISVPVRRDSVKPD